MIFPADPLLRKSKVQDLKRLLAPQPPRLPWAYRIVNWLERALWL